MSYLLPKCLPTNLTLIDIQLNLKLIFVYKVTYNSLIKRIYIQQLLQCKGSFGGRQAQPSASPWHLLIIPLGLQPFLPHRFVSLLFRLLPTLIIISSSSIDSLYNLCLACLLPTVRPGNTPYNILVIAIVAIIACLRNIV